MDEENENDEKYVDVYDDDTCETVGNLYIYIFFLFSSMKSTKYFYF